jgi:hypothetical protein
MAAALLTVALAGLHAADRQAERQKVARQKYDQMMQAVQSGNLNIEWRVFRMAAQVADVASGFDWKESRDKVMAQSDSGDLKGALAGAQEIISHNFADPEGHMLAAIVYGKMDQTEDMTRERAIVDHIVESIRDSGDGKSKETAYFTVSVPEEYFFLRVVMGATPKSQALVNDHGHGYDQMTVTTRAGKEVTVWFLTDLDLQKTREALGDSTKSNRN